MITRFAPSPTGYLHLGHALAAKTAFEFGGTCLLRIEDIDHTRYRPEYTQGIYEDLSWLGFEWPKPVRIQSEHIADFEAVVSKLEKMKLVYKCFMTRSELKAATNLYQKPYFRTKPYLSSDEEENLLKSGKQFAVRLDMRHAQSIIGNLTYEEMGVNPGCKRVYPDLIGDGVVVRKDINTSYHVACCHDDAQQAISHVVRGADFIEATGFQRILQTLMGWPEPVYHHHRLLENADGEKLAKRNKDTSIRSLRDQGFSPSDVLDMASRA